MRALVIILVLASTAVAQPKKAPDRFAKAASEAFSKALDADQQNDLPTALGLYQKAFAISPHPSTAYNIADVFRRQGKMTDAIEFFEVFLALSPGAKEAKDVEALIVKLAATPAVLLLKSTPPSDPRSVDIASAYVIVNGEIVKRAGEPAGFDPRSNAPRVELSVPSGREQQVDVITPLSYGHTRCRLPPGEKTECTITMEPRKDGSLVFSAAEERGDLEILLGPKGKDAHHARVMMPAGKVRLFIRDHAIECPGVVADIPRGTDVAYVFLDAQPTSFYLHCRPFKVKQHRLTFAN